MLQAIPLLVAAFLAAAALTGCDQAPQVQQVQQTQNYNFADEDACEDAGMSDKFCDEMFPEAEDFLPAIFGVPHISKTKYPQTVKPVYPQANKMPIVKPVYKPAEQKKPLVVNPVYKPDPAKKQFQQRLPAATVKASVPSPSMSTPSRTSVPSVSRSTSSVKVR